MTLRLKIDIAPNILNLQRTDDKCVTVHTNIPYDEVDRTTVILEAGVNKHRCLIYARVTSGGILLQNSR